MPCEEPPFYKCGSCPTGFTGNGTNCVDLDEVSDYHVIFICIYDLLTCDNIIVYNKLLIILIYM